MWNGLVIVMKLLVMPATGTDCTLDKRIDTHKHMLLLDFIFISKSCNFYHTLTSMTVLNTPGLMSSYEALERIPNVEIHLVTGMLDIISFFDIGLQERHTFRLSLSSCFNVPLIFCCHAIYPSISALGLSIAVRWGDLSGCFIDYHWNRTRLAPFTE